MSSLVNIGLFELAFGALLGWLITLRLESPETLRRFGVRQPRRLLQMHIDYVMMGLILIAVGLAVPDLPTWIAVPLVFGTARADVPGRPAHRGPAGDPQIKVPRLARPEVWVAVSFSIMQLLVMFGVVFAGRVDEGGMVLLVWACVGVASRLPTRAVVPLTAWSIVLYLAAWLLTDPRALIADPALVTVGAGILITCSAIVTTLRNSDSANHAASIIDQLTGLFNRGAFERRIQEHERATTPPAAPTGVVLLDIDHFKGVNDELGHDRGDDVLRSVAETLAAHVREGEELYRLGGEEFIVLLPGTAERAAAEAAERLLASVRSTQHAGVDVTISAGVTASPAGVAFSWRHAYHDADTALYAAKEGGRDQVRTATAVSAVTELRRAA